MQVTPEMGFILCQVSTVSTCASEVCVPAGSWAGRPTAPGSVCGSEVHAGAPAVLKQRDKPSHVILCSSLNLNFWVWSHTDSVLRVLWDVSTIMLFKAFFFCDFIAEGQCGFYYFLFTFHISASQQGLFSFQLCYRLFTITWAVCLTEVSCVIFISYLDVMLYPTYS